MVYTDTVSTTNRLGKIIRDMNFFKSVINDSLYTCVAQICCLNASNQCLGMHLINVWEFSIFCDKNMYGVFLCM